MTYRMQFNVQYLTVLGHHCMQMMLVIHASEKAKASADILTN